VITENFSKKKRIKEKIQNSKKKKKSTKVSSFEKVFLKEINSIFL
jgi:hypothetical protein